MVTLLGYGSVVAAQKLKCENEKDIMKVSSQAKTLLTSVHQNAVCHICCYGNPGSTSRVLFEYPAPLEMHLPQCIRQYLEFDWFIKLIFVGRTSTGAFFLYENSSYIVP